MSDASSDPQNAFKVVWIAGMPRSGSMWAYNIARETLAQGGYRVFTRGDAPLPETSGRAVSFDTVIGWQNKRCAKAVMARARAGEAACLKTHELIGRGFPRARFNTTLRDVRGAALSFMRFNRCDFEQLMPVVGTMMTQADYYASFADAVCLKPRYADIVGLRSMP